ncbi:MAG: flagellar biosynthetic protein FliR [Calditrichia bacterium]
MNFTEYQILLFFLILIRFTSMMVIAPVFGIWGIPIIMKIGVSGIMALLVFGFVSPITPDLTLTVWNAAILVAGEFLTGLTIGMIIKFLFSAIQIAGEYISLDMGLTMAQQFDPMFNQQISIVSRMKNILAMLVFIIIDGHHYLIEAVVYSFRLLPIGTFQMTALGIDKIMHISASVFVIGVKMAAPAIVSLFLTSVAMGITARAVPQMNIFFVGFPVRIAVGFIALIMGLPMFVYLFKNLLTVFEKDTLYILQVM